MNSSLTGLRQAEESVAIDDETFVKQLFDQSLRTFSINLAHHRTRLCCGQSAMRERFQKLASRLSV
ncbi:MAG: hypothetical protein RIS58_251 [Actinomycetota bacterium]|jgi:hypothetical protein